MRPLRPNVTPDKSSKAQGERYVNLIKVSQLAAARLIAARAKTPIRFVSERAILIICCSCLLLGQPGAARETWLAVKAGALPFLYRAGKHPLRFARHMCSTQRLSQL